ncbi:MAG: NlpC/P60 family protein [Bacteroidota bacterium]
MSPLIHWLLPRVAPLAVAVALFGFAATPAAAQADVPTTTPEPTASPAPIPGAVDTAAPRRRPTPRRLARPAVADSVVRTVSSPTGAAAANSAYLAMVESTLRGDGPNWIGIPYRWGGTTRRGIDCSAFVQQYVRQNLGIELPRTTAYQRYEGVEIDKSELLPGDLVFFRRRGIRHVGVYLSDGEFIHASSSRGVTISNLSETYWTRHYWMSRRILNEPSGERPTPRSARG